MLNAETALREEFRAEASSCDEKVVDSFYDERTERNFVPVLSVVDGLDSARVELKNSAVDVNGIVRLTEHIVKFHSAEKVLGSQNVLGDRVSALTNTDEGSDIRNVGILESAKIFLAERKLTRDRFFALYLCLGEVLGVGSVGIDEKFGVVERDASASSRYRESLPICFILGKKVAVFDRLFEDIVERPAVADTAGGIDNALAVGRRAPKSGSARLLVEKPSELVIVNSRNDISKRNRLVLTLNISVK
jgi:hypothetical protein